MYNVEAGKLTTDHLGKWVVVYCNSDQYGQVMVRGGKLIAFTMYHEGINYID